MARKYLRDTSAVSVRILNTHEAYLQYTGGTSAVPMRHIWGTGEDIQYWRGRSSVPVRMIISTPEAYHQYLRGYAVSVRKIMSTCKAYHPQGYWRYFIDPFTKCHRLVHNGGFPKFEALYYSLNMVSSTEIPYYLSYKVQSSKSQSLKPIQRL